MNGKRILAIGELLWDMLPDGKCVGGAPLNFAYWANKAGCRSALISALGKDDLGKELYQAVSSFDVDFSALQFNAWPTGTVQVKLSPEGEPKYEICENVAWDHILDTDEALRLAAGADAVCWGSLAQRTEEGRKAILKIIGACPDACIRVFDINLRQNFYTAQTIEASLGMADILKLNETEWPKVMEMFSIPDMETLMQRYSLQYVILTSGAVKSEVFGTSEYSSIPTPRVDVVSTVGAGDSFTATFIAGLLENRPLSEAHGRAVEVSADVCRHAGAMY